jgi:5-methylcytosine-specific restriction endonuclease McrA
MVKSKSCLNKTRCIKTNTRLYKSNQDKTRIVIIKTIQNKPKVINKSRVINKPKYRKKNINKTLREKCWLKTFGNKYSVYCPCCEIRLVTPFSHSIAHIKAESKGGQTILRNLIVVCTHCNSRMGTQNYYTYKNSLK